jgi:hypothetical protein
MIRTYEGAFLARCAAIAAFGGHLLAGMPAGPDAFPASQVTGQQLEREIQSIARQFPEIGPGVTALKRDAEGRYYILALPATAVAIYSAEGKRLGQIPNANSRVTITYAEDIDLDPTGRLFVADRGANAVKVFTPDGALVATIRVTMPASIVALSGGEVAVVTMRSEHLVDIFDEQSKLVRAIGQPSDLPDRKEVNRFLNRGRICGDPAGNIYFAFTYLPDPVIKKYDRYGYAAYEIDLSSAEFAPEDKRRDVLRLDRNANLPPALKPTFDAIGVDPATQDVWAAIGDALLHFDKDGTRRGTYRTFTKEGARLEPRAILVEPGRLLLAADPIGIFEFARPDKITLDSQPPFPQSH